MATMSGSDVTLAKDYQSEINAAMSSKYLLGKQITQFFIPNTFIKFCKVLCFLEIKLLYAIFSVSYIFIMTLIGTILMI